MADATGKDGAATEHIQEAQLATWPENAAADASGAATDPAISGNATEHAIAKWQAMFWRKSKDCHHVIQVVLSLRANANCQELQLEGILLRHLPRLFAPNMEDAFFAMLEQETITDANLCYSVVDFCAKWPQQHKATYQELLADSAVVREMNVCLPRAVPMWRWIRIRLADEIYMTEEETGSWTIHVDKHSDSWEHVRAVRQNVASMKQMTISALLESGYERESVLLISETDDHQWRTEAQPLTVV